MRLKSRFAIERLTSTMKWHEAVEIYQIFSADIARCIHYQNDSVCTYALCNDKSENYTSHATNIYTVWGSENCNFYNIGKSCQIRFHIRVGPVSH